MKKILFLFFLSFFIFSCAHVTLREAEERINIPIYNPEDLKETRIRVINENREKEKRNEITESSLYSSTSINTITFPYFFTNNEIEKKDDNTLRILFIPLGEETLDKEELISILNEVSQLKLDIISLTGSLENQINFISSLNKNAVVLNSGSIVTNLYIKDAKENTARITLTDNSDLSVQIIDIFSGIPYKMDLIEREIEKLGENEEELSSYVISSLSSLSSPCLVFLSSFSPDSKDWTNFSPLSYRYNKTFLLSEKIKEMGFFDTFEELRFSVETNPGITRRNGEVSERMDFIYEKGLFIKDINILQIQGLTDRKGINALIAEFVTY